MSKCRFGHQLVFIDGFIYAIGGWNHFSKKEAPLTDCERLNLKTGEWDEINSLSEGRADFGACSLGSSIYVFGGRNLKGLLGSIERY